MNAVFLRYLSVEVIERLLGVVEILDADDWKPISAPVLRFESEAVQVGANLSNRSNLPCGR